MLDSIQMSRAKISGIVVLSLFLVAGNVNFVVGRTFYFGVPQDRADSLNVAIGGIPRYSRKEMRVHRFLWNKWRHRQTAMAQVTYFGIDAGNIYTVNIKKDSNGRWVIMEYLRHYQAPEPAAEPTNLVATGIALRWFHLRNGAFIVRLVTEQRKTVALFE
jgi:hypothetical protein